MLALQDISAARLFYERAANAGSARAAMALGETYNATFLARLGAVGTKPNPAMAEQWYRKAAALGSRNAEDRLRTLRLEAAR
jgi:TPR repeat protein